MFYYLRWPVLFITFDHKRNERESYRVKKKNNFITITIVYHIHSAKVLES